jgi:hypothetical protein
MRFRPSAAIRPVSSTTTAPTGIVPAANAAHAKWKDARHGSSTRPQSSANVTMPSLRPRACQLHSSGPVFRNVARGQVTKTLARASRPSKPESTRLTGKSDEAGPTALTVHVGLPASLADDRAGSGSGLGSGVRCCSATPSLVTRRPQNHIDSALRGGCWDARPDPRPLPHCAIRFGCSR